MKKLFYQSLFFVIFISIFCFPVFADEKEVLLHFVHLSDTHINYDYLSDKAKLRKNSGTILSDAIEQVNNMKEVDFVLITGDLVNLGKEELVDKFVDITMSFNPPVYVTLGNHDVGVNTKLGKDGLIKKFYDKENPTSFPNQVPYYSFYPNDQFVIICLDTTSDKAITSVGFLGDEQLQWLEAELEKNKDRFVIIAIHMSPIEPVKTPRHFFAEPDRTRLLDLINSNENIIGLFSGDYHLARIIKLQKKIYVISPATVKYPNAFREIIITRGKKDKEKGKLIVEFKWHTAHNEKLVELSKSESESTEISVGSKKDRERIFKFKIPEHMQNETETGN